MPRQPVSDHPSLEGFAGGVVGFTVTYLGVEAAFPGSYHPIHWAVTLVGGALGYLVGHLVFLWHEGRLARPRRGGQPVARASRPSVPRPRRRQR